MLEKAGQVTSDMHMFFCFADILISAIDLLNINTYGQRLNVLKKLETAYHPGMSRKVLSERNLRDTKIFSTRLLNLRQFA